MDLTLECHFYICLVSLELVLFLFFIFGVSPENFRLWKLACGCYSGKDVEEEMNPLPNEESIKKTKALDGSVSFIVEPKHDDERLIDETADYFELNNTPTTHITTTDFTPTTKSNQDNPDSPLPRKFQNSSRNRESHQKSSKNNHSRNSASQKKKSLPPPPQLLLNGPLINDKQEKIVASRGYPQDDDEERPNEMDLDDGTDYIQL